MSKGDKLGGKCAWGICPCPEHGLVITVVAIGVLNRRLGFADTSQADDTLWLDQGCSVVYLKCPAEACEHVLPSCKKGGSSIRNIPNGRNSEMVSHGRPLAAPNRRFLDHASSFLAGGHSFP